MPATRLSAPRHDVDLEPAILPLVGDNEQDRVPAGGVGRLCDSWVQVRGAAGSEVSWFSSRSVMAAMDAAAM